MGGYNFGVGLTRKNHDPPCGLRKKFMTPPCSRKTYRKSLIVIPKWEDGLTFKLYGTVYIDGPRIGIRLKVGRWAYFQSGSKWRVGAGDGLTIKDLQYTHSGASRHF